jgi:hypothetical protein
MVHLIWLLLATSFPELPGLDIIPPASVERAARGDASVRTEINRISACLQAKAQPEECLDDDSCTLPSPSACANVSGTAWRVFMAHYLELLDADAKIGRMVRASQKLWGANADADCATEAEITETRRLPYQGFYAEGCVAGSVATRALALRNNVINLFGDASVQSGEPYAGRSPFIAGKR